MRIYRLLSNLIVFLAIVSIGSDVSAQAEDVSCFDFAGPYLHWEGAVYMPGYTTGVSVMGNYAYFTNSYDGFTVIDISDTYAPQIVSNIETPGWSEGLDVEGSFAFVADYQAGFTVIDISDPAAPQVVANIPTNDTPYDLEVVDGIAYVADWYGGLLILDVTTPQSPQVISTYNTGIASLYVHVDQGFAYVSDGDTGLHILDVSDPANPFAVGLLPVYRVEDLTTNNGMLFVAEHDLGLLIYDIADRAVPRLIGEFPSRPYGVAVSGNNVILNCKRVGTKIIDISVPAVPVEVGQLDTFFGAWDVVIDGDLAYVTEDYGGMRVFDVTKTNPFPEFVALDQYGRTEDAVAAGGFLFVAGNGLNIADISNPLQPSTVATVQTLGTAYSVDVLGQLAFVGASGGLQVVDIADPSSPQVLDSISAARSMALGIEYAYIVNDQGLQVVDFSNSSALQIVGTCPTPDTASGLAVVDNLAYVADQVSGLQVVDISNPSDPVIIGSVDTPGNAQHIATFENVAYIADREFGIQIVDISNPEFPELVGNFATPGCCLDVAIYGKTMYLATEMFGCWAVDISDPLEPIRLGGIGTNGQGRGEAQRVTVSGGKLLVPYNHSGLQVLPLQCEPEFGSISGHVTADCESDITALYGVSLALQEIESGRIIFNEISDELGCYSFENVPFAIYEIVVSLPNGYLNTENGQIISVLTADAIVRDVVLNCEEIQAAPRGAGYWKHLFRSISRNPGNALPPVEESIACEYLDLIDAHFANNVINQILVYQSPTSGLCEDKLAVADGLINIKGNVGVLTRSEQQLFTLLLNVVSGNISQAEIISEDGHTVSQAISYCDQIIDDVEGDYELAKNIAEYVNSGNVVPTGWMPIDDTVIAYRPEPNRVPNSIQLEQNHPNPFNPSTTISFSLPHSATVSLRIYDVAGKLVNSLIDGQAFRDGHNEKMWNGTDDRGQQVPTGIYFYKLTTGDFTDVRRMALVK